jgi:hypothetical protein
MLYSTTHRVMDVDLAGYEFRLGNTGYIRYYFTAADMATVY